MRIGFIILALIAFGFNAMAQRPDFGNHSNAKDSINRAHDSLSSKPFVPKATNTKVYHPDSLHSPHKAFMRSIMVPGWGQIYNHQWWKVPLVYGGLGGLGAILIFNQQQYRIVLAEARARQNGTVSTGPYRSVTGSADDFFNYAAGYQRNFQLSILGVLVMWGINGVDAYIDAKFIHSFSVDNNLTFKLEPTFINQPTFALSTNGYTPGIKLTLGF